MRLTEDQIDTLLHYADGEARVRQETKLNAEQLRDAALDFNVEKCPGCGWWAESHEMIPDGGEEADGYCLNCRLTA